MYKTIFFQNYYLLEVRYINNYKGRKKLINIKDFNFYFLNLKVLIDICRSTKKIVPNFYTLKRLKKSLFNVNKTNNLV